MPLILRNTNYPGATNKNSTLTYSEVDNNFIYLDQRINSSSAASTGSLLVTASVSSNVITFTKGNASTFSITVNTGSVDLSSYITNSQTSSMSVATASYVESAQSASYVLDAVSSSYALTASYALNGGGSSVNTGSLATTGSNIFKGEQTISGSIQISGSIIPAVSGSVTSSFSLGSATNAWKDIYVSNGTINFLNGAGAVQATLSSTADGLVVSGAITATNIAPTQSISSSVISTSIATLDLEYNKIHKIVLEGNGEIQLTNPITGSQYTIIIKQMVGGEDLTWPANVVWVDNRPMQLPSLNSVRDTLFDTTGFVGLDAVPA